MNVAVEPYLLEARSYHFGYVFERFPTATQTFCVREVLALEKKGVRLLIFSIRDTSEEKVKNWPQELSDRVITLPQEKELVDEVLRLKDERKLPQSVVLTLRYWGEKADKQRIYEAAWIGYFLEINNIKIEHLHCHFAGVGARALWWVKKFYGINYSVTGHANDLFCDQDDVFPEHEKLFDDSSALITVSEFTAQWLKENYTKIENKIEVVYNGLDLEPFEGRGSWIGKKPFKMVSVGRLIEKKGFPDLIRACGGLRDRAIDFRCRIIGEGPMREELEALIAKLSLTGFVTLVGEVSIDKIVSELENETSLFVLPCVVEADGGMDNLPTVIMEAMAAGLPVVSTTLAGVPEMVDDKLTGELVEPNNVEALIGSISSFINDEDYSRSAGVNGREKCKRNFSQEVTSQALLEALTSMSRVIIDSDIDQLVSSKIKRANSRRRFLGKFQKPIKVRDKNFDLNSFMNS